VAGSLTLRVITPDAIVLDEPVESLVIPGLDGLIGILPRHAPMVAALDVGLASYRCGGREHSVFVSGGFAEVRGSTVRLVSAAGEKPADIDEARAREAEQRARQRLDAGKLVSGEPLDLVRAELALKRAQLRLRARRLAGL
jgi:F-type H+-transporting ATPase subunit epsilon